MTKILLVSRCAWTLYNFRQGHLRALKQRGDTVIGGGAAGDGFEPRIEALGVPFAALPVHKKAIHPLADLRLLWHMYRWYRRERPDIVHHFTIKPVLYGSLAARLAGVPRIINSIEGLGLVFSSEKITPLRRVVEIQYKLALWAAHRTLFLNRDDQQLFIERGLTKLNKTELLPGCGVDTTHFAPPEIRTTNKNGVCFLLAARMLRPKGVYEFVEAARIIRAEFPSSRFILLGGRDERSPSVVPQEDLERWNREEVVCWQGEVADVREVMEEADVVVLPSYYREGTPRSLMEAAALSKALITTDNVGCREIVDDGVNGLLVPMRDVPALANAMRRLICNPELRERMGRAGREKILREFDERIVLKKILAVYDQKN